MCVYNSPRIYLESLESVQARIVALNLIIDQIALSMLDAASGAAGVISMYELDDGQSRIKTNYRSMQEMESGMQALIRLKNYYINQINGPTVVLRPRETLRGWGGGCC